jgi:hypothetical protein
VASFFLFWGFEKLLRLDLAQDCVTRALIILAAWPASFILFAGYPESLVIALVIWSTYVARKRRWWLAGLIGLLAGTAKAVGALVVVPLAFLVWRHRDWRALPAALCLLGPAGYALFLNLMGLPQPSQVYPGHWGTTVVWPWTTLFDVARQLLNQESAALNTNFVLLLAVFVPVLAVRVRTEYTLFALAVLCTFLMKKTEVILQSTSRYALEVFPAFASLARLISTRPMLLIFAPVLFLMNLFLLHSFFEWSLDI